MTVHLSRADSRSDEWEPMAATPKERVLRAITEIGAGRMIIMVDDADRENEGDLVFAAEHVTPELINFMAVHARGLICLSLDEGAVERLRLPMMVQRNTSRYETAFTVSIEASTGVSTGISAADRARTIAVAADPESSPEDLVSPGHVFPLRARRGGVLVRSGQTEGSVDLARLAGLEPAAVICEIMNEDGTMARMPELIEFGRAHRIPIVSVADLINYRMEEQRQVHCVAEGCIETGAAGVFRTRVYRNDVNNFVYIAAIKGEPESSENPVLVRMHSGNVWGDALDALRLDRGVRLNEVLDMFAEEDDAVLVYILKPFRPEHVVRKLFKHSDDVTRFEEGRAVDTPKGERNSEALRDYGLGAQVLRDLGVRRMRLVTNSPIRIASLEGYGLELVETVQPKKDA